MYVLVRCVHTGRMHVFVGKPVKAYVRGCMQEPACASLQIHRRDFIKHMGWNQKLYEGHELF